MQYMRAVSKVSSAVSLRTCNALSSGSSAAAGRAMGCSAASFSSTAGDGEEKQPKKGPGFRKNRSRDDAAAAADHARYGTDEHPFGVSASADLDYSLLKLPFLRLEQKAEMYALYKADPEQWTIPALAAKFNAKQVRVKAVLFLQERREEEMAKDGVKDIPAEWAAMHTQWIEWQMQCEAKVVALQAHSDFLKLKKRKKWLTEEDAGLVSA